MDVSYIISIWIMYSWKIIMEDEFFIESKMKYLMNLEDEDHGFSIHYFVFHV
jgi:hypothetical protein